MIEHFKNMGPRLMASTLAVMLLVFVISTSYSPILGYLVPMCAGAVVGLGMWEYYKIATLKGLHPRPKVGILLAVLYIFATFFATRTPVLDYLPLVTLGITLIAIFSCYFCRGQDPFVNSAVTLFAFLYLAIPLSYTIQINYFFPLEVPQDGRWWLCYLFVVTYATDSMGLLVGKTLGRRKLAPYISPNKTWEGAIGGFLGAIGVSYLFYLWGQGISIELTFWHSLILGGVLSILAQFGDLAESLLKRDVGVKDSAKIPGLGGVLDVVDSLVFTTPMMYLYLHVQWGMR